MDLALAAERTARTLTDLIGGTLPMALPVKARILGSLYTLSFESPDGSKGDMPIYRDGKLSGRFGIHIRLEHDQN